MNEVSRDSEGEAPILRQTADGDLLQIGEAKPPPPAPPAHRAGVPLHVLLRGTMTPAERVAMKARGGLYDHELDAINARLVGRG